VIAGGFYQELGRVCRGECAGLLYSRHDECWDAVQGFLSGSPHELCKAVLCMSESSVPLLDNAAFRESISLVLPDTRHRPGAELVRNMDAFLAFLEGEVGRSLARGCAGACICLDMGVFPERSFEGGSSRQFLARLSSLADADVCAFLCIYDRRSFSPGFLVRSLQAHTRVIVKGRLVDNRLSPMEIPPDGLEPGVLDALLKELENGCGQPARMRLTGGG
jgi:hypothetical protein